MKAILLLATVGAINVANNASDFYNPTKFEVKLAQGVNSRKMCEQGQVITVEYTGRLKDAGTVFDSTKTKGPFSFVLG